jgi:type II secretory pathway component PulF
LIEKISGQQDRNLERTNAEVEKMTKFRASVVTSFFGRLLMLIFALAVFCFMLVFIRLFPNKIVL